MGGRTPFIGQVSGRIHRAGCDPASPGRLSIEPEPVCQGGGPRHVPAVRAVRAARPGLAEEPGRGLPHGAGPGRRP